MIRKLVVFADIKHFSRFAKAEPGEPEIEAAFDAAMSRFFDACEASASAHDGVHEKFLGDGVLAMFDTDRGAGALRYAIEVIGHGRTLTQAMLDQIDDVIDTGTRVGIARGKIRIVERNGRAHEIRGDVVNLAARLQAAAPADGILLTARAADTIRQQAPDLLESAEPFTLTIEQVKGQSNPIRCMQLCVPRENM
jgi:class 3 adenylate cyclase